MKLYVVTNARGQVVGAFPARSTGKSDGPSPGRPAAMNGQRVHEVEYAGALDANTEVSALHKHLASMLRKPRSGATKKPAPRHK